MAFEVLRDELEARRKFFGFVAVRHPDVQRAAEALEQRAVVAQQFDVGVSVLALVAGADFAAQLVGHVDAARSRCPAPAGRDAAPARPRGRVGVIDRRRASGEDDAGGRIALDFFQRGGAGEDDGEDVLFADAARDELGVLRAEVEDDDRLGFHFLMCQRTGEV